MVCYIDEKANVETFLLILLISTSTKCQDIPSYLKIVPNLVKNYSHIINGLTRSPNYTHT